MQAIIVRAATLNDLPELSRLWHEKMVLLQQFDSRFILTPDAVGRWPDVVTAWLEDDDCRICVAERDHRALGYAVAWVKPAPPGLFSDRIGYITEIVVDAHAHQGGLGRLLLSALREWFTAQEIQQIVAYVPHRGAVEQAFWRAQGATEWVDLMWIK
jgi:ribosomal protein S18 acetylase RimI-like enzyme